MKAEDFTAWREKMGLNRVQSAEALGLSRNMPKRYEDGEAEIPLYIALACAALDFGLPPWRAVQTIGSPSITDDLPTGGGFQTTVRGNLRR